MKAAIVFPPNEAPPILFRQIMEAVQARYRRRDDVSMRFFAFPKTLSYYQSHIDGIELTPIDGNCLVAFDEALLIQVNMPYAMAALPFSLPERSYILESTGAVRPLKRATDERDDPVREAHVFNRLGPRDSLAAHAHYYFPWSYLYREPAYGPINEIGHRIDHDYLALVERDPGHKVIACYGGSAAWGWDCLHHQVWTARLDEKLNAQAKEKGLPWTFTVLNFAGPGHVVMNEIFHFILFGHQVPFDVVISHSGANDLYNGQLSDPWLLETHHITYQQPLESWARILHDSADRPGVYPKAGEPMSSKNPPAVNLRAYVARIRQFRDLARAVGAIFVWGLQPMIFSRRAMAPMETGIEARRPPQENDVYEKYPALYEMLCSNIPDDLAGAFVNHHRLFSDIGEDEWLFWDSVHPAPKGQDRIAGFYLDHFVDKVFPLLKDREEER